MFYAVRRIVTGHDADGRSIIVSDETADSWDTGFGRSPTSVWTTLKAPAGNRDDDIPPEVTGFAPAGSAGVGLMVMQIPPESNLDSLSPEERAKATVPVARLFPQGMEIDTSKSPKMHATDTMDYVVLLSGEITLLVDDGEVTLKPFDIVIQRGVNHGWVNRGTETAILVAAVLDAEPLVRKRSPLEAP
jgi:quercetin dioxygenase-like cupin family protein